MKQGVDIKVQRDGDVVEVQLAGAVDAVAAEKLKAQLNPLCEEPGVKVLVDCGGLTYINSLCMGQLSAFSKKCKAGGGAFALYAVEKRILDVMRLIHLHELMPIRATREDALIAVGK
jgi:anti-anti-sigma factor